MDKCNCWEERSRNKYTYNKFMGLCDGSYSKTYGACNGTREQGECDWGGDESKCDFYEEVRMKAKKSHVCANCIGCEVDPEDEHARDGYDSFVTKDEIPPMTNADYIRKLDDEELSDYLVGIYSDGFFDGANDEADWSDQYSVDWLRQPYKKGINKVIGNCFDNSESIGE